VDIVTDGAQRLDGRIDDRSHESELWSNNSKDPTQTWTQIQARSVFVR